VTTFTRLSVPGRILLGSGLTLLIVGAAAVGFLSHLVRKSAPTTEGVLRMEGLHSAVRVHRDQFGIPHIVAADEHDLMMATGFVQAQDRLWQMDLMRRAGQGRLAEIMGDSALQIDCLFRTIGIAQTAARMKDSLHPSSRLLLDAYARGVNSFLASAGGSFPVEFDMLNYRPEPWRIEDCLIVARLMAWELNLSWWTDLTYGEIASRVPAAKFAEILPGYSDTLPTIVPPRTLKKAAASLAPVVNAGKAYCALLGLDALSGGSNAWAVDSTRSISGRPILANDPHLALPAPSRWYEMHLSAPGWNVSGVALPGVPVIVIGHNEHLAWGLTNAMVDDADFYVEKNDSLRSGYYRYRQGSLKFSEREEKIFIGSHDSLIITVRSTVHGPVLNDIHPMLRNRGRTSVPSPPVTMRWTGSEVSDEIDALYRMNIARNREEFLAGVREFTVPAQEVLYADDLGTIACWTAGRVPLRGRGNPLLPLPGWTGDADWQGFIPFDQLPAVLNPPEGFIICANQKPADKSYPTYLSYLWEPPSRSLRLRELMGGTAKFSADDFKQFQQDVMSVFDRDLTRHILRAYDSVRVDDPIMKNALTYLRNWDYRCTVSDIAGTIIHSFLTRFLHNTFDDELDPETFGNFVFLNAIPYRITSQLLAADSSLWWDDSRTAVRETKNDIIRKSLAEALQDLTRQAGPDMKTWRWGSFHTVTFTHPFGSRKPLQNIFNIGPYPVGGSSTTVSKMEFDIAHPYAVTVGPSMRFIVDMSHPLEADIVTTGGESGQPFSRHYNDQTPLWLAGGYVSTSLELPEPRREGWEDLSLEP